MRGGTLDSGGFPLLGGRCGVRSSPLLRIMLPRREERSSRGDCNSVYGELGTMS